MADLLEDPDGAPYPAPVQELWQEVRSMHVELVTIGAADEELERYDQLIVDALESVVNVDD